jgi:hypothetical protein
MNLNDLSFSRPSCVARDLTAFWARHWHQQGLGSFLSSLWVVRTVGMDCENIDLIPMPRYIHELHTTDGKE